VIWLSGALLFGVWWCQGLLLYLPNSGSTKNRRALRFNEQGYQSPAEYELDYEDVDLKSTSQISIHAWFCKQPAAKMATAPTVVMFHGNAGNIGYRLPLIRRLFDELGCNVFAVDYRGYGNSEGTPSEHGLVRDSQAAIEWLTACNKIDQSKIFIYGQSLGGAVSIKCAHMFQERVCGLIVENTFTSIDDMVVHLGTEQFRAPWIASLRPFFAYFLTSHWPSIRHISEIRIPILFLSGLKDELIPPSHMSALHDAARSSPLRCMATFPNGSHNDTVYRGGKNYFKSMVTFIAEATTKGGNSNGKRGVQSPRD
jgi:pimeloyl-ACP methyl ester carboxylesterase